MQKNNNMLYQIIYVSQRACDDEEIKKILEKSQTNNKEIEVTGLLMYTKDSFIQCIEGEKDNVNNLYDKIKKDDRHRNSVLISYRPIKKRDFPAWNMGEKNINVDNTSFMAEMSEDDKKIFDNILAGKEEVKAIELIKKFL